MIGKIQEAAAVNVAVPQQTDTTKEKVQDGASDGQQADNAAIKTDTQNNNDTAALKDTKQTTDPIEAQKLKQQEEKKADEKKAEEKKIDEKSVKEMTKELNKLMKNIDCDLEFNYYKELGMVTVKLVDKNTDEVIKECPPEDMIKGMIKAKEWIGTFLDKNA